MLNILTEVFALIIMLMLTLIAIPITLFVLMIRVAIDASEVLDNWLSDEFDSFIRRFK